ncbi:MAG TPA: aspartyl/asparaginyl beta-hydroxylase domain-containing protein [Stellaceae bacterium]
MSLNGINSKSITSSGLLKALHGIAKSDEGHREMQTLALDTNPMRIRIPNATRVRQAVRHPADSALSILNKCFAWAADGERRAAFHDIDKVCPSLRILDQNYRIIQNELESVLTHKNRIPRYHEISPRETYISGTVNPDKDWRIFTLATFIGTPTANREKCPQTTALIDQIPGVISAFFSILDAGKSIPAHCGPSMGYLRYHLALRVPKINPPSIRVKDQYYAWEEGESIVFDDSWEHEVFNESNELRVVLIVDIFRPMPLPLHMMNRLLCRTTRYSDEAKQAFAQIEKYSA